jgi:high-affinity K+ transport system ATPase subunit B
MKNMEQKTQTQKSKNENGGLTKFLLENIFGIVKSFVDGMFENAEKTAFAFTRKVIIRAFLIFLIFLGIIFLLIGMARLLSAEYQLPGAGEALVGLVVLLVSFVLYVFIKK